MPKVALNASLLLMLFIIQSLENPLEFFQYNIIFHKSLSKLFLRNWEK